LLSDSPVPAGPSLCYRRSSVDDRAFDDLRKGELVEFESDPVAPKGPRARLVKRAAPAPTGEAA